MSQFIKDMATASLLACDPIAEVERMTQQANVPMGEREKLVAVAMHVNLSHLRREHLESIGDTTFSNSVDRYTQLLEQMDFQLAYHRVIDFPDDRPEEYFYIYAQPSNGVVIVFDTHHGVVNSAHAYFVMKMPSFTPSDAQLKKFFRASNTAQASYGWESPTLPDWRHSRSEPGVFPPDIHAVCSMDAREALFFRLRQMGEAAMFVNKWPTGLRTINSGPVSLYSSYDLKSLWDEIPDALQRIDHCERISKNTLNLCPEWFRNIINLETS